VRTRRRRGFAILAKVPGSPLREDRELKRA
jgi:hypothetical protein